MDQLSERLPREAASHKMLNRACASVVAGVAARKNVTLNS
jgi:hypothetical protein